MLIPLKSYPRYNLSRVEWLGDAPGHWDVARLKSHARNVVDLTEKLSRDDIYIALENVEGWTGKLRESVDRVDFESQVKRFRPGDVLFGKLRPYLAKVTHPSRHGVCVGEFLVLRSRLASLLPRYLERLLRSKPAIDVINASTFGAKMPRADWQFIGDMRIPLPPTDEQAAIVRYLDYVDRRARRYLAAKWKLIALLEEERQAVIHHAVTRGLDPNVPLKPSGVEWLGDIPAHWEVVRLSFLSSKFGSGITPRGGAATYQEHGIPFLRSQNVHFNGLRLNDVARISPKLHEELSGTHVKPGDVLLNITGASIGRVCSVPSTFREGNVNQHVCIIRPIPSRLVSGLLSSFLSTPMIQREIQQEQSGASREGLTLQSIRNFWIVAPPISEQAAIVEYLDIATTNIDTAMSRAHRQIELLEEYRTRLIADVVTGKLDVRAAAAALPDEKDDKVPPWAEGTTDHFPDAAESVPGTLEQAAT